MAAYRKADDGTGPRDSQKIVGSGALLGFRLTTLLSPQSSPVLLAASIIVRYHGGFLRDN